MKNHRINVHYRSLILSYSRENKLLKCKGSITSKLFIRFFNDWHIVQHCSHIVHAHCVLLYIIFNFHAVGMVTAQSYGFKVDFLRNPISEAGAWFFFLILKFNSTSIFWILIFKLQPTGLESKSFSYFLFHSTNGGRQIPLKLLPPIFFVLNFTRLASEFCNLTIQTSEKMPKNRKDEKFKRKTFWIWRRSIFW